MKANEITLAILKASKVISLENGNVVEYIKASTFNEDAYNKAIARGEDIVLFKTSESDNKARAVVSVNGIDSSYPLYINEIKTFAETGMCPTEKTNFFITGVNAGRTSNGTHKGNGNKKKNKPLTKEELSDKINKHVDALQNAYTNFYNLLVSWGIDTANINFANFDSSEYFFSVAKKCISDNNELKKAQAETAKIDVKKTLLKTGLSKEELLAMVANM